MSRWLRPGSSAAYLPSGICPQLGLIPAVTHEAHRADVERHVVSSSRVTSLDIRVIDNVLEMGGGYVLDFTDRTFAEFFSEHGVQIDDSRFSVEGTSKAKRLRYFLKNTLPPLTGRILAALLQHRLAWKPDGMASADLDGYRRIVLRLGGELPQETGKNKPPAEETTEAALLRRVFRPEVFAKLPVDSAMSHALVERMNEAQRCIAADAHLAAVILCGSVLEGMCLGFGSRHPERVNRAYAAQHDKSPRQFHEWKLKEWIDVLGRLGALSPNIEKFSHALRDFRNYVHPAEQLAHRFSPDQHTARIGFQVVIAAAEDLVRAEAVAGEETTP